MAGYCGSKHALHSFFDALRNEGPNVTIVLPWLRRYRHAKEESGWCAHFCSCLPLYSAPSAAHFVCVSVCVYVADGGAVGDSDTVDRGHPMPVATAANLILQVRTQKHTHIPFTLRLSVRLLTCTRLQHAGSVRLCLIVLRRGRCICALSYRASLTRSCESACGGSGNRLVDILVS